MVSVRRCRRSFCASFPIYDREKDAYPASVVLDRNFRSAKGVTDAVNFVFRQLMSRETGDLDYGGLEELVPAASYPDTDEPAVELELLDLAQAEEDEALAVQEARRFASLRTGKNGPCAGRMHVFCCAAPIALPMSMRVSCSVSVFRPAPTPPEASLPLGRFLLHSRCSVWLTIPCSIFRWPPF